MIRSSICVTGPSPLLTCLSGITKVNLTIVDVDAQLELIVRLGRPDESLFWEKAES